MKKQSVYQSGPAYGVVHFIPLSLTYQQWSGSFDTLDLPYLIANAVTPQAVYFVSDPDCFASASLTTPNEVDSDTRDAMPFNHIAVTNSGPIAVEIYDRMERWAFTVAPNTTLERIQPGIKESVMVRPCQYDVTYAASVNQTIRNRLTSQRMHQGNSGEWAIAYQAIHYQNVIQMEEYLKGTTVYITVWRDIDGDDCHLAEYLAQPVMRVMKGEY